MLFSIVLTNEFIMYIALSQPTCLMTSPTMVQTMIAKAKCDFTCFEFIAMGGSAVPHDLVDQTKVNTNNNFYSYDHIRKSECEKQ